jgi:hypothetical protein
MLTLFNPFSLELKKNPIENLHYLSIGEPVYSDGDYRVFKKADKWYLHCYKHVIFAERCGINKQMIEDIKTDTFSGDGNKYHCFDNPKQALIDGLEWSKKYSEFDIN